MKPGNQPCRRDRSKLRRSEGGVGMVPSPTERNALKDERERDKASLPWRSLFLSTEESSGSLLLSIKDA